MQKLLLLLTALFLLKTLAFCQNFEFKWSISPSLAGNHYTLQIFNEGRKTYFYMEQEYSEKKPIRRKIKEGDCDTLLKYLSNYNFSIERVEIVYIYEYFPIEYLEDTNLIKLGDKVHLKISLYDKGYEYIADSNKYRVANLSRYKNVCTDGIRFEGYYKINDVVKKFEFNCRDNIEDYCLNYHVLQLIKKYNNKFDFRYYNDYFKYK